MKTKNRILALAILIVSITAFTGCSKDKETNVIPDPIDKLFCWECTLTMKVTSSLGTQTDTQYFDECEKTETQIRSIEADNTYVKNVNGATLTVKTKCVKK